MTSEITKIETQRPNTDGRLTWYFFAALILFVYFFGLTIPFLGPDEARYAQVAREMLDRGDWITPTLGGFNWFEKPPLLYWLAMVSYKVFGVNEFTARFGPALFGLGTVASLWILGSFQIKDQRSKIKDQTPFFNFPNCLALIAASTLGIMVFSRGASFDIIITFPITAALVCFYVYDHHVQPPATAGGSDPRFSASLVLFYVFIGVALLAKGLIGIIFPLAIVGVFYVFSRRMPNRTFVISLLWGTFLAVAIASIWYLPMYLRHGDLFIDEFFIQHHFQRFTSNRYQHPQPFYFFLWVLPLMTLPWLPFFLASIWTFTRRYVDRVSASLGLPFSPSPFPPFSSSPLLLFSASWLLVPLIFFSFSGSKLPGYILPAVPAAIVFTVVFIFELSQSNKWRTAILLIAASAFVAAILLIIFAVPKYAESDSVKTLIQTANERGYHSNRVLTLHTISHNAEFYAAGRLLRDAEGRQRYLSGVGEVINEIHSESGHPVLVLVPLEYLPQLTGNEKLNTEVLKENAGFAIAAVSLK